MATGGWGRAQQAPRDPMFWGLDARSSRLDPSHPNLELLKLRVNKELWRAARRETRALRTGFPDGAGEPRTTLLDLQCARIVLIAERNEIRFVRNPTSAGKMVM